MHMLRPRGSIFPSDVTRLRNLPGNIKRSRAPFRLWRSGLATVCRIDAALDPRSLTIVSTTIQTEGNRSKSNCGEISMNAKHLLRRALLLCALLSMPGVTCAQGTGADYSRALLLRNKFQALAVNIPERANWIDQTTRFWYRRS